VWLGAIGRTAGVLEHQREAVFVARQRDRSRRPVSVKFALERIFVFERLDATEWRFFRGIGAKPLPKPR
jgi:hypothetical protein